MKLFKHCLPALLPYWLLDLTLRISTGCAGWYPLYALPPHLFSLGFGMLFVWLSLLPRRRRSRGMIYGLLYAFWAVYIIIQYGIWRIFGRFLFLSDFRLAGEGMQFIQYIRELIDSRFVLLILLAVCFLVWGIFCIRNLPEEATRRPAGLFLLGGFVLTQCITPVFYGPAPETADWDDWNSGSYEYRRFSSPVFDMALTGPYQFVFRDFCLSLAPAPNQEEKRNAIDAFFAARPAYEKNPATGLLRGKNLILVQLESIDDFVLNDENTPVLARLQREGICFREFYTPQYANGYTFNTEFAAQTGLYPCVNGSAAYSLNRNAFPYSIASLFADAGYQTNSFHKSEARFYNRGLMHQSFGYSQYYSALDYAETALQAEDDCFLVDCDALYQQMTAQPPFLAFLITYSAHLGYDARDALTTYALEQYPVYQDPARPYEINGLFAKARLTDRLFEHLLKRLEQDGLLNNTVICVYDDHYAYGLTDRAVLEQYSSQAGGRLLERTPCFVWYQGCTPQTVTKTLQAVDLSPTLANLFGLPVPPVMGRDAFDPAYPGFAIFPDTTWLSDLVYVQNGVVQWNHGNHGREETSVQEMNRYVSQFHEINDAILATDYYQK